MIHQYPYHVCMQYMHRFVRIETEDGQMYEGFIANVDQQNVTLAIPSPGNQHEQRQFWGAFGGAFPYGGFFPYVLPLAALAAIYPLAFFI